MRFGRQAARGLGQDVSCGGCQPVEVMTNDWRIAPAIIKLGKFDTSIGPTSHSRKLSLNTGLLTASFLAAAKTLSRRQSQAVGVMSAPDALSVAMSREIAGQCMVA